MNTIAERIYDYLKGFPPFNLLTREQLLSISKSVDVIYLENNQFLFEIGQPVANHFYVVRDGAIGLFRANNILVDKCDEGDIFGLRALLRKGEYKLNAKAIEESIVYSISLENLEAYITANSDASQFLMASFASNIRVKNTEEDDFVETLQHSSEYTYLQTADYSKNPITCSINTSIKDAASIMTEKHVGSIVIVDNKRPIGIITDKDLRTKIATGKHLINDSVSCIMSSPVIAYPETITIAEAQIAMLKHKITHLCITKDGTNNTELTGILSEHDIIVLRENNASALIKEIKRSRSAEQLIDIRQRTEKLLERYLEQDIPIDFISRLVSAINDTITQRIIEFSIAKMDTKPPTKFAWLAIGSQGRQEQLLMTDQDNALVFENVDEEKYNSTQSYFLKLSDYINKDLETVGFELCPAQMMANNPKWCQSVMEWSKQFNSWITTPDQDNLMLCTIFFDYEHIYGDKELVNQLSESLFKSIDSYDIFLNYLGRNALLNPPPLSFFRQFLVEDDGEHKDHFDIKARAMMPLVDAARLLILSHNIKAINNTLERYEKLIELEPQNKDTYLFCIEAYKNLLTFRTKQGLKHNDSGRFIDLESLDKGNRLQLKRSFKAVKEVQELIKVRFKLSQLL
ncbi:MAG: CBS domain-containing protein [Winogradskyella sp.]|nr:CBS domain-containing protein [Winogradskyella sp.]